jgi:hypothetical protein
MALEKLKENPNGITINYWRIYGFNYLSNEKMSFFLAGYVSKEARDRSKDNYVDGFTYEFPMLISELPNSNILDFLYSKVKESKLDVDENLEQVEKNWFFDAVDV